MGGLVIELMALVPKLGELLGAAMKFASDAAEGDHVDPDKITDLVAGLAKDWHPKVRGKPIFEDVETRRAGIRFLVGIAIVMVDKKIAKRAAGAAKAANKHGAS